MLEITKNCLMTSCCDFLKKLHKYPLCFNKTMPNSNSENWLFELVYIKWYAHYWLAGFKYWFNSRRRSMRNIANSCWKVIQLYKRSETSDFACATYYRLHHLWERINAMANFFINCFQCCISFYYNSLFSRIHCYKSFISCINTLFIKMNYFKRYLEIFMWTYPFEMHRKINIDSLSMFNILKYDIYKKNYI